MLWSLLLWGDSKTTWMFSFANYCRMLLQQGVGLGDLQKPLPTPAFPWLCQSRNLYLLLVRSSDTGNHCGQQCALQQEITYGQMRLKAKRKWEGSHKKSTAEEAAAPSCSYGAPRSASLGSASSKSLGWHQNPVLGWGVCVFLVLGKESLSSTQTMAWVWAREWMSAHCCLWTYRPNWDDCSGYWCKK